MSFQIVSSVLMVLAAQGPAGPDSLRPGDSLPFDSTVSMGELENGVRYYVRVNGKPEHRAELRLVLNVGSVLEDDDQRGLAHFAEHMAFNGTEHFPKQDLIHYLEGIGMRFGPDINAYTSFDETVYMLTVPTDSGGVLERAFQILEDWAHRVSFDAREIDMERGVVIEEWRLGRGAAARMRDKQLPLLFHGSRYAKRLPIGEKETLKTFPHDALRRFYRDWYRPDLMAVVGVGDFDRDRIVTLIRRHFAAIAPHADARVRPAFAMPGHEATLTAIATDREATGSSVTVYHKRPARSDGTVAAYRQRIVETLYHRIFDDRLYELTQMADPPFIAASSGRGRFVRPIETDFLGAAVEQGGVTRGLEAILTEAERLRRHGVTPSELARHQRELLRAMERAYDERDKTNSAAYAAEYVRHYLLGEPVPGVAAEHDLYQRLVPGIDAEEVNAVARSSLGDANRVIVVSAPDRDPAVVPTDAELVAILGAVEDKEIQPYREVVSELPLIADSLTAAPIIRRDSVAEVGVTVWELANGVRVVLKPTTFKDDEIVFMGVSPGGTSLVPDDAFVAAMTAAPVVRAGGAGAFSRVELDKLLADKAVHVEPFIGDFAEGMRGSASPKDVETMFQLVYLYFTQPRRDTVAYLSFKSRMQAFVANRNASPEEAFHDTLQVTMAQHHFRARPLTSELLDEMDLARSFAFYRDRYADAADFTFVFVGRIDLVTLERLVRTYLGNLPTTGRLETWKDVGIEPPRGVVEKAVRRGVEPKSQTQIVFTGSFDDTREARHALRSLAQLLELRLRDRLREDMGGTYSVTVGANTAREPDEEYRVSVRFGSAPERVEELVSEIFREIESLKTAGPADEEIARVREIQRRTRETSLERNQYWLSQLVFAARYDVDFASILRYEELIDALGATTIRQAARRYLVSDRYVRVSLYPEGWGTQVPR